MYLNIVWAHRSFQAVSSTNGLASFPGHSQILSRSCGVAWEWGYKQPGYEAGSTFWTYCRLFHCDAFLVQWILYWLHFQQSVEYQNNGGRFHIHRTFKNYSLVSEMDAWYLRPCWERVTLVLRPSPSWKNGSTKNGRGPGKFLVWTLHHCFNQPYPQPRTHN